VPVIILDCVKGRNCLSTPCDLLKYDSGPWYVNQGPAAYFIACFTVFGVHIILAALAANP
jgi:hypothetical protein